MAEPADFTDMAPRGKTLPARNVKAFRMAASAK